MYMASDTLRLFPFIYSQFIYSQFIYSQFIYSQFIYSQFIYSSTEIDVVWRRGDKLI